MYQKTQITSDVNWDWNAEFHNATGFGAELFNGLALDSMAVGKQTRVSKNLQTYPLVNKHNYWK